MNSTAAATICTARPVPRRCAEETPTGARPQREHLGQPHEGGALHGELIERTHRHDVAATRRGTGHRRSTPPRWARRWKSRSLIGFSSSAPTSVAGRKATTTRTEQAVAGGVVADQTRRELADARRRRSPRLRRSLPAQRVARCPGGDALGQPEQALDHEQMPGRQQLQELGDGLDALRSAALGTVSSGPPPTGDDDGHKNGDYDDQRPRRTTTAGRGSVAVAGGTRSVAWTSATGRRPRGERRRGESRAAKP